jgi:hypothetical protein
MLRFDEINIFYLFLFYFILTGRFQVSPLGRQICRNGDPSRRRWAAATLATRASAEQERNFRRGALNTELRHSSDFAHMLKYFIYQLHQRRERRWNQREVSAKAHQTQNCGIPVILRMF